MKFLVDLYHYLLSALKTECTIRDIGLPFWWCTFCTI